MALVACSERSTGADPPPPPARALFIGNSLTRHTPAPAIGWHGDWGMAASAREQDYAHRSASALQIPLEVVNLSTLETDPAHATAGLAELAARADARTLVVVELGDNVPASGQLAFAEAYAQLLSVLAAGRLVCLSTWWRNGAVDALMEERCTRQGGRFVTIGDIYPDPTVADRALPPFENAGVNAHPRDGAMARIAERIVQAARSR